jgi:hypothetical protein
MRTCIGLCRALALFTLPFFFALVEVERLLGFPDGYNRIELWLVVAILVMSWFLPFLLYVVMDLYNETN